MVEFKEAYKIANKFFLENDYALSLIHIFHRYRFHDDNLNRWYKCQVVYRNGDMQYSIYLYPAYKARTDELFLRYRYLYLLLIMYICMLHRCV